MRLTRQRAITTSARQRVRQPARKVIGGTQAGHLDHQPRYASAGPRLVHTASRYTFQEPVMGTGGGSPTLPKPTPERIAVTDIRSVRSRFFRVAGSAAFDAPSAIECQRSSAHALLRRGRRAGHQWHLANDSRMGRR